MFRIQIDVGHRKVMIMELKNNVIHYFSEIDNLLAIIGPLQPEETPNEDFDLIDAEVDLAALESPLGVSEDSIETEPTEVDDEAE